MQVAGMSRIRNCIYGQLVTMAWALLVGNLYYHEKKSRFCLRIISQIILTMIGKKII